MFNFLRKTWKQDEGASQNPAPVHPQEGIVSASTQPEDIPLPHGDTNSLKPGNKRSREEFDPETQLGAVERPLKAPKTGNFDSIRNHLPEIIDSRDREETNVPLSVSALKNQIFEHAKQQNTIAVLPSTKPSLGLLVDIVLWAVSEEHDRQGPSRSKSRTALLLVEDGSAIANYLTVFEEAASNLTIANAMEDNHLHEFHKWMESSTKDLVIVTSNLLLQSLLRGTFAMAQAHLLVICDAQAIKNQDSHNSMPIVRIMNDFYHTTELLSRPCIFALASLSADRRLHFDSKMLKLEQTLDAKVFGVTDEKRAEILALPDRPDEVVILYDNLQRSTETRLLKQLRLLDPSESVYRRHFLAARHAHDEVGPCASDLIWRRALKEMDGSVPWFDESDEEEDEILSEESIKLKMRNIVRNWAFAMPNLDASSKGFNVSHKFLRLVQILMTFKSYSDGFRGIIFVCRRAIALVLADLLRTLDDRLGFLRPQAVVGQSTNPMYYVESILNLLDSMILTSSQQEIFQNFATGVCNLLIATKSMEDMDVPKASVVIRYDLFESQTSHAYVRARTRGRESHLIHMAERGNDIHRRVLSRITNIDASMLRWTEALCNTQGSAVPPESLQETVNPYHSDSEDEEAGDKQFIKEPTTSGRIYNQDATTVLYRYAASARSLTKIHDNHRLFEFEDIGKVFGVPKAYRCIINLPDTPVHGISGDISSGKAEARRSACFKACEGLYFSNLLDFRLVPLPSHLRAQYEYENQRSPDKDVIPDVRSSGTRTYQRKQPNFWTNVQKGFPSKLYPIIFYVDRNIDEADSYGPLALLTRQPLPDFHPIRLFSSGIAIQIRTQRAAPLLVDEERMKDIHAFSIRLCRAIMNKALICQLEDMAYFLLPLPMDWQPPANVGLRVPDIREVVPWDVVSLAAKHWAVPIKNDSPEDVENNLKDAVVQDRWIEFTRRYKVVKVRRDLTPLSKPVDSVRESNYESLWHFCQSKRKGLEALKNYEQPIIEVAKVHAVLNHLNPTCKPPSTASKFPAKYLIPELCAKFTVPASTMKTAMFLPSILRRVDDLLLVKEMNARFFDHAIREDLLHNALCTPAAGLEYDYERLELLGDAFLKYLASVYVFVTNPSLAEGALHVARQKIISNRSLLFHASRIGMPTYIQSKVFAYKGWQPPNFRVYVPPKIPKDATNEAEQLEPGEIEDESREQDKSAAPDNVCTHMEPASDGDQPMEDIDDSGHLDEEAIQEHLVPCASEPVELDEAVVEPEVVEEGPCMPSSLKRDTTADADGEEDRPGAGEGEGDDDPIEEERVDGEYDGDVEDKDALGSEGKADGEGSSNKPSTDIQAKAPKKKSKPKKKKSSSEEGTQSLGDKAIADVAEAIIGAAYITGGREAALQVTKSMTLPLSHIDRWSDFGRKVLTPPPNFTAKLRPGSIVAIEQIIGHKFNRPHLLAQAMTHSSIQGYEITSYERLEFIGDAILDFMVIRHIYDRDQQLSPGALTMLKGAMVSNSALAAVSVWSGLHEFLLFESSQLEYGIRSYVNELKTKKDQEYELAKQEGRSPGQYWMEIEPPKALSDVVESIIGAIYISDNFSPVGAESLFDNVLKPFFDTHITLQTLSHHPTKILFELLQAQGCQQFEITKDKEDSITHCYVVVHRVVLASGEDPNPALAARRASFFALDALEGDPEFMTRTCDCRTHQAHKKPRKKTEFEKALEKAMSKTSEDQVRDVAVTLEEENEQAAMQEGAVPT